MVMMANKSKYPQGEVTETTCHNEEDSTNTNYYNIYQRQIKDIIH